MLTGSTEQSQLRRRSRALCAGAPSHVAPEELDAFLKGGCSSEQAARVEGHIDDCEECRVLLSSLVRGQRDLAADPTHQVTVAPVTEGDVVAGKYRIERIIGAGGMGSVLSAWHQQLNQRVALKFMLPSIAADPHAAARFLREGRAAARLSTPHVGRVIDLDSLPNGTPYLVMEHLEGETLAQRLTRGALPVQRAVDAISQALVALQEAHGLGVVHRDFKPANLFFARRPDGSELVKVLDFGIAKSVHPDIEEGLVSTSSRMLIGSPPYMAPEQISFQAVDTRTDVWAVGAVLYEMLTGRVPFEGKTVGDVMFGIQNKAHEPLARRVPAVPANLSAIVDRCLAKKPLERYADAAALANALRQVSSPPPEPARPPPWRARLAQRLRVDECLRLLEQLPAWERWRALPLPARFGALGFVLALAVGALALGGRSAPPPEPAPLPPVVAAVPLALPPPVAPPPSPAAPVLEERAPRSAAAVDKPAPARKPGKRRPPARPNPAQAFEERR